MEELVMYFAKSAGILLLFLGLYFLVLRRETFFQENRFFMLSGMLISLLLPFIVITQYIDIPAVSREVVGSFIYTDTTAAPVESFTGFSWIDMLIYVYLAGVVIFFGKFLIELFSLFRLLWKSEVSRRDGQFIYIETNASLSPFSFFNYIVYNPALYSASELEAILKHEQAHSRQMHSIDVFVSRLYCIFFWFNPFAWMHKKFMLQNLEFLADSAAIKQTPSKKEYQLTLLKVSGNTYCPALTNNFYNSLIKKRIVMLQKTQSTQINRWKQILILPMLIAFVFMFNTEVIAKEVPATDTNTHITTVENDAGDLVVVITKSTTKDELKAYKKLFKSQKIKFDYSNLKFNSKGEIKEIFVVLSKKDTEAANGKFETIDDRAISDIQLGIRGEELFVKSTAFDNLSKGAYTYTISTDYDEDGSEKDIEKIIIKTNKKGKIKAKSKYHEKDVKTIDIKSKNGQEVVIVNGKEVNPGTTIDVENEDGKEVIILNGKHLSSEEIIQDKIEIQGDLKSKSFVYSISTDYEGDEDEDEDEDEDDEEDEKTFKIIRSKESKITFSSSDGDSKEKPLFIVDGKEMSNDDFAKLDHDTIATMTVLKDKAAIKEYGDKGKNGVIIITTRKKKE